MLSFAAYRLPRQQECTLVTGEGIAIGEGQPLLMGSFAILPFRQSALTPTVAITPKDISQYPQADLVEMPKVCDDALPLPSTTSRDGYSQSFEACMRALRAGDVRKVVLSRCVEAPMPSGVTPLDLFKRACRQYPRAFVALFSTPITGTWLIATPELLLEGSADHWSTMALAGTMQLQGSDMAFDNPVGTGGNMQWSLKNRHEQLLVSAYISQVLMRHGKEVVESKPRTVRAANLVHLRTDFSFVMAPDRTNELLRELHPTPAVCGLPKGIASQLLEDCEKSPRQYYSGACGPLGINDATHLYVSLRCMRIAGNRCFLYAGGGLLPESDETAEWDETEAKMQIMREVLGERC